MTTFDVNVISLMRWALSDLSTVLFISVYSVSMATTQRISNAHTEDLGINLIRDAFFLNQRPPTPPWHCDRLPQTAPCCLRRLPAPKGPTCAQAVVVACCCSFVGLFVCPLLRRSWLPPTRLCCMLRPLWSFRVCVSIDVPTCDKSFRLLVGSLRASTIMGTHGLKTSKLAWIDNWNVQLMQYPEALLCKIDTPKFA